MKEVSPNITNEVHRNGEIPILLRKAMNEYVNLKNVYESQKDSAIKYAAKCDKITNDLEVFINEYSGLLAKSNKK